jgi:hypothetical protein
MALEDIPPKITPEGVRVALAQEGVVSPQAVGLV